MRELNPCFPKMWFDKAPGSPRQYGDRLLRLVVPHDERPQILQFFLPYHFGIKDSGFDADVLFQLYEICYFCSALFDGTSCRCEHRPSDMLIDPHRLHAGFHCPFQFGNEGLKQLQVAVTTKP